MKRCLPAVMSMVDGRHWRGHRSRCLRASHLLMILHGRDPIVPHQVQKLAHLPVARLLRTPRILSDLASTITRHLIHWPSSQNRSQSRCATVSSAVPPQSQAYLSRSRSGSRIAGDDPCKRMTLPQVGQIGGRGNDVCPAPAAPLAAPFGGCCCCCCMTGLAGATTCCSLYKRTRSSKSIAGLLVSARNRCAIVVSSARTFGSFAVCASLRHFAASSRSSCSRSVTITLTGQTQIHTPGHDGEPCRGQKVPQPALKPAVRRSS
jgi:hypothetical protein